MVGEGGTGMQFFAGLRPLREDLPDSRIRVIHLNDELLGRTGLNQDGSRC